MKIKFCFLAVFMLAVFQVHSQRSIGLSVKPLVSGVSNTNKWSVSDKYRVGWQINGEYINSFSKKIDFSVGAGLSVWQVGFEKELIWPSMLSAIAYEKYQIKEILIPLDVSLNLKGTRFFMTAGVTPTFVLSAQHLYNYFEPEAEKPWRTVYLKGVEYNSFNIGAKIGLGMKLITSKRISWVISPEIKINMLPDSPESLIWFTTEKIRRCNLGIKLGVQYKLKTKKEFRTLG